MKKLFFSICVVASCAHTVNTRALEYSKTALFDLDRAVDAGLRAAIRDMTSECARDELCVTRTTGVYFESLYALRLASTYLAKAEYFENHGAMDARAVACAVLELAKVNRLTHQVGMAPDQNYKDYYEYLKKYAGDTLCSAN